MKQQLDGNFTSARTALWAVRLALAASFLSAVADRFGLWGELGTAEVAWGSFDPFVKYTGMLLWFLPDTLVTVAAWCATILEVILAMMLIAGIRIASAAFASGLLLALFAVTMTFGTGPEGPLSYSVWTASAAAFLLATHPLTHQSEHRMPESSGIPQQD